MKRAYIRIDFKEKNEGVNTKLRGNASAAHIVAGVLCLLDELEDIGGGKTHTGRDRGRAV